MQLDDIENIIKNAKKIISEEPVFLTLEATLILCGKSMN